LLLNLELCIVRRLTNIVYISTQVKNILNKVNSKSNRRRTRMQTNPKKPKRDSFLIAISFLFSGIALFVVSVFLGSQIICVIGLGLIFWGALFLIITPQKYIESSFLVTSTLPAYLTMDRMLIDLNPKNEAYNIPPFPRDIYLPQHLEGLKDMVTFIPAENTNGMVEIEDIARGKFIIEKPKGILITSPGKGLLDKIEQKHTADFAKIPLSELDEILPNLLGDLYLAKEITMTTNENNIILQIKGSLYENLYSQKYNIKIINLIGCPLVNAAACAIAKSTGKLTMIQEIKTVPNGKTTTVTFKIVNMSFEKRQKLIAEYGKATFRRNELVEVINASIGIVDLSFDILIGLHKKRINWQLLEGYSKAFGETLSFTGQSMPSLNLGFLKISSAIKNQVPKETSKEAYSILKVIYGYFDSLSFDDDLKASVPNFLSTKAIILSYYTLNDLLLGKAVGDKENKKEAHQLESVLQILTNDSSFKVNIEELMVSIGKVIPENDLETFIDNSRGIFKEWLSSFLVCN
jgi:hypothetical protein